MTRRGRAGVVLRQLAVLLVGGVVALVADRAGATSWLLAVTGLRPFGRPVTLVPPPSAGIPLAQWRAAHGGASLLLVVGQSQAANFAEREPAATDSLWVLLEDRVVRATAPLPGAEGTGGSLWPGVVGDAADSLVVAAVAVGATTMADWSPGGPGWALVARRLDAAAQAGLTPRAVVVMVGEADAARGTSEAAWRAAFDAFRAGLVARGVSAPIMVVRESRCFGVAPSAAIRRAQAAVVDGRSVVAGPDLDALDHRGRWDGCHWSLNGLRMAGNALAEHVHRKR